MGDTKKPAAKVRDYRLYELERIAAHALRDAERCLKGRRVDIERLVLEKFKLKIETFVELRRRWDTYAFIDTTGTVIFIDADLMNETRLEKNTGSRWRKNWRTFSSTGTCSPIAGQSKAG